MGGTGGWRVKKTQPVIVVLNDGMDNTSGYLHSLESSNLVINSCPQMDKTHHGALQQWNSWIDKVQFTLCVFKVDAVHLVIFARFQFLRISRGGQIRNIGNLANTIIISASYHRNR